MRLAMMLAVLAGVSVAFQAVLTAVAQKTLGPAMLVAISGGASGLVAVAVSPFLTKPEFTVRAVAFAAAAGVLVAIALGCIAFSAAQIGVSRTFSLVIGTQLVVGLVLDGLRLSGTGADLGILKVFGVALIVVGSVLVVRF